jgi:hypothetical protein
MHLVQPPQCRHRTHHHLPTPDDEVHRHHCHRHGQPGRCLEVVEQTPNMGGTERGHADRHEEPQPDGRFMGKDELFDTHRDFKGADADPEGGAGRRGPLVD